MAAPTPYSLSYDFTAFQSGSPTTPLPADKIEIEYNNLSTTTDEIIANLGVIQRSDTALANEIVTRESLAPDVVLGVTSPTPWLTATVYVLNDSVTYDNKWYICMAGHTSGVFATDLASLYWQELIDLSAYQIIDSYIQDVDADTAVETERTADDDTIYIKCAGTDVAQSTVSLFQINPSSADVDFTIKDDAGNSVINIDAGTGRLTNNGANLDTVPINFISEFTVASVVGDGFLQVVIPAEMNGMTIVGWFGSFGNAVGTGAATSMQVYNVTLAADIFSTNVTIDDGERSTATAATPAVINAANDALLTGDVLRWDFDVVGSTIAGTAPQLILYARKVT